MRNKIVIIITMVIVPMFVMISFSNITVNYKTNTNNVLYSNIDNSNNWAGYVAVTSYSNPQPDFQDVSGSWIVQKVSSSVSGYSSQWIGIGGFVHGETLIQTGTASNSNQNYYAWYELLPQPEVKLFNVNPGNIMCANIYVDGIGSNQWTIVIKDVTTGVYYDNTSDYSSSLLSAEWIEERPVVNGQLSNLADFGTAYFGTKYTDSTHNMAVVDSGSYEYNNITPDRIPLPPEYYIGQMANYQINMVYGNTLLASTSSLTGQHDSSFAVCWHNSN